MTRKLPLLRTVLLSAIFVSCTTDRGVAPLVAEATQVTFLHQPTDVETGAALTPAVTVAALNAAGQVATTYTGSITVGVGTNPGGSTLSGTKTVSAVGGVATFSDLSLDRAGTGYRLSASANGLTGTTSATFDVTAPASPAATHLGFVQQPTDVETGAAITPAVTVVALDSTDQVVATYTGSITVGVGTNPGGSTLSGTTTVSAVAGVATFSDLGLDQAGTGYRLSASANGLTGATSGTFDVTAPPALAATHLGFVQQPTNVETGTAITPAVTVAALDSTDQVVATYTGSITVGVGTNPGGSTLSGTTTVSAVAGVATFSDLGLDQAGTGYRLSASANGLTGTTSAPFDVTAPAGAVATHLGFGQQPTNAETGAAITPAVTVVALDSTDQVVTTYTGSITVGLGTNPGGSALSGTKTVSAAGGVATFSDLSLDQAGTGYRLSASANGLTGATSSTFEVTAPVTVAGDTIFSDGFESGSLSAWDDNYLAANKTVVTDASGAHSGSRYLRIDYPQGSSGGSLSHFFLPGYDTVTVSYWVKFPANWQGGTKLLLLRGSRTDNVWSSFGVAGDCPDGTQWFVTNVVVRDQSTLPLRFYTYYVGMSTESDGVTCYGRYGDTAQPPANYNAPLDVSKGVWHKVELEVILNTPGVSNGSQSMWLDGTLKGTWTGINFRNTSLLKLNVVTLESSMNETQGGSPQNQALSVDDVLVTQGLRH